MLRQVARLSHECFRSIDCVGRMGGEEFAVLLPGATLPQAATVAQRFAQRLAATLVVHGEQTIHLSATLGVAERLPEERTLDAMLQRADQALYAGKNAGRNCVMLALPEGTAQRHAPEPVHSSPH